MKIQATSTNTGQRLDMWLDQNLENLSRSRIQELIKKGNITLDGRIVKSHQKISKGMIATVLLPPLSEGPNKAENIPIDVIYEDMDIVIVNKKPGMVVHPAVGHPSGTMVNALLFHCKNLANIGGEIRPGIAHRLDRDTSGVMVVAKNDRSLNSLINQFKVGKVLKEYEAIVYGHPHPPSGSIETLIGRNYRDRKKMSAQPKFGRKALTHYATSEIYDVASRLKIRPYTGRTHQIRVHMSHMGHPILGDKTYGGKRITTLALRQMLHAKKLSFLHPSNGNKVTFNAPLPTDIQKVIDELRKYGGYL